MRWSLALLLAACGGPPILSHLPRPDPAVVAASAAAIAGAATIADPKSAGRPKEQENPAARRTIPEQQMPGDVLDRMDGRDAGPREPTRPPPP